MRIAFISILALLVSASANAESVFGSVRAAPPELDLTSPENSFSLPAFLETEEKAKTGSGAAAWSLLVPGLGQEKLGYVTRARVFYGLEAAAWVVAGSYFYAGKVREEEYKEYAVVFAGVKGTDRPDSYWEAIGMYLSSDGPGGYNEEMRREARDYYYPDVEAMNSYYRARAYSGDDSWKWRDSDAFYRYGQLRDDSRFAYRYAIYAVFASAALRIVSAADAMRIARISNRAENAKSTVGSIEISPFHEGARIFFVRPF